jgi:ergothioneine biosynthesis protein EgtB
VTLERLQRAWERSDDLFGHLADPAWLEQPIRLRQPFVFYLGHLPAFAWNHLGRGLLGRPAFREDFDALFERGIDPTGVDAYTPRATWPELDAVREYKDRVRAEITDALSDPGFPRAGLSVVAMVVEHELMHHETLQYMLQELDHELKSHAPQPRGRPIAEASGCASAAARDTTDGADRPGRVIEIPDGEAVLGAPPGSLPFGWDNEFEAHRVHVPRFAIDELPVTNADFRQFALDGGYAAPELWREEDWAWRQRSCVHRPHSWRADGDGLRVRGLYEDVPFDEAARWPVMVSWAEASAYARWRGARLPTEAEWQRAARGTPEGRERRWPWGDEPPAERHGSFHFRARAPLAVGSHPAGASAWGVQELVGNGWEWTATVFAPFPGFAPLPRYPGYSADFFDGAHFVLLGASWATDEALLRPSFRNWFQPHYPYVFSKFRLCRD